MKKLIAVLMLASFAGAALPVAAQTPSTPAPAATAPAASDKPMKSDKKHSKKHKKESKGKTEPKNYRGSRPPRPRCTRKGGTSRLFFLERLQSQPRLKSPASTPPWRYPAEHGDRPNETHRPVPRHKLCRRAAAVDRGERPGGGPGPRPERAEPRRRARVLGDLRVRRRVHLAARLQADGAVEHRRPRDYLAGGRARALAGRYRAPPGRQGQHRQAGRRDLRRRAQRLRHGCVQELGAG